MFTFWAWLRARVSAETGSAELYRQVAAAKDRGEYGTSPQTQALRIAAEAGIRLFQALAGWAEWARTVPPATPAE
jgi:hypothetical protein